MVRPRLAVLAVTLALAVRRDDSSSWVKDSKLAPFPEFVLALSSIAWLVPDAEIILLPATEDGDTLYTVEVVRNGDTNANWKLSDLQPRKLLTAILATAGSSVLQASEVEQGNSTIFPGPGPARPIIPFNIRASTGTARATVNEPPPADSSPHAQFQRVEPGRLPDAVHGFSMILQASLSTAVERYLNELVANTADEPEVKAEKFLSFTAEIYKGFGRDGAKVYTVAEKLYSGDTAGAAVTAVVSGLAQLIQHRMLETATIEALAQVAVHEAEHEMFTKGLDALSKELSDVDALKDATTLSRKAVRDFQKKSKDRGERVQRKRRNRILKVVRTKLKVAMGVLNIWKVAKAVVAEGGLGELADGFQDLLSGDEHPWQHMAGDMSQHANDMSQHANDMTQHAYHISQHLPDVPHFW